MESGWESAVDGAVVRDAPAALFQEACEVKADQETRSVSQFLLSVKTMSWKVSPSLKAVPKSVAWDSLTC